MKRKHRWVVALASFVSVAVVLGFAIMKKHFLASDQPALASITASPLMDKEPDTEGLNALVSDADRGSQQAVLMYQSKFGPLPDSLDGTVMGQALVVDESGHLRISSDIKRVFDFFLSTIEEESLETILARIDEYLQYYLNEPALGEAKQILSQYIDLKKALYNFEVERSASLQDIIEGGLLSENKALYLSLLEQQLEARNALRAQYLSLDVQEVFYAEEQEYDRYTLARMRVVSDDTLTDDEKAQQLADIDSEAPEQLVKARQKNKVTDILKARTAQLREQGADEAEIRQLRTEMLGSEAANRFEALDKERAQWQQRIDSYLKKRQEILASEGLSVQERERQVNLLRSSLFDSREQIRVSTLERHLRS